MVKKLIYYDNFLDKIVEDYNKKYKIYHKYLYNIPRFIDCLMKKYNKARYIKDLYIDLLYIDHIISLTSQMYFNVDWYIRHWGFIDSIRKGPNPYFIDSSPRNLQPKVNAKLEE